MSGDRFIEVILWALSLVLAIVFFYNGVSKIIGTSYQVTQFESLGIPANLLIAVGVVECMGGLMLTIPRLTVAGGSLLVLIMLTSATLHLLHDNFTLSLRAIVIVVMLLGICYLRHKRQPVQNQPE